MNMHCYMLLEKLVTMLDIGFATSLLGDIPESLSKR